MFYQIIRILHAMVWSALLTLIMDALNTHYINKWKYSEMFFPHFKWNQRSISLQPYWHTELHLLMKQEQTKRKLLPLFLISKMMISIVKCFIEYFQCHWVRNSMRRELWIFHCWNSIWIEKFEKFFLNDSWTWLCERVLKPLQSILFGGQKAFHSTVIDRKVERKLLTTM